MRHFAILLAIILLGFFLRVYKLDVIPNGFFFDEATISYQAYSVLKTGKDTWNNFLPVFSFKDYGEYILPVGVYGQMVGIIFGGLNVLAMRLPHAMLGTVSVLLVYLSAKEFFDKNTALIAALLLAVSPLSIGWSRFVFEGNFGTVLFLTGVLFYQKFIKTKRGFEWSMLFFGLSIISYHVFLVLTPLFVLLSVIIAKKYTKTGIVVFAFFCFWGIGSIISGSGRERFSQTVNNIPQEKLVLLNNKIGVCSQTFPKIVCQATMNKPLMFIQDYALNYVTHFSPQFLFFDGSYLRRNILPPVGLLTMGEILIFYLGFWYLIKKYKQNFLILSWLFIYPLANSFTGTGEISRVAFAAPVLSLVSAYGLSQMGRLKLPIFLVVVFGVFMFLIDYFTIFPHYFAYNTDFGYDKIFKNIDQKKFDNIYISRNYSGSVPYISMMFFKPVDPTDFQAGNKVERVKTDKGFYEIQRLNNVYFYKNLIGVKLSDNDFLVATPEENFNCQPVWRIIDPTGRILFNGYEIKKCHNN